MELQINAQLGLQVLVPGADPVVDIIAVHGLGANPVSTWVYKDHGSNPDPSLPGVNWLSDLLPDKVPTARVMTFNYESRWHSGAPKQRCATCAEQLLTALHAQRVEENITTRPLIFIGHSFGGVVIEQALVTANLDPSHSHISVATAGLIFLGTPHRGTSSTKWAQVIATAGAAFGFSTNDSILKDLSNESAALKDLLHTFSMWVSQLSVPLVCFFEQHETDYGARFGITGWKRELVVSELSACLDGHRKIGLPTDHIMINKYSGPNDPSFRYVYPVIQEMAQTAVSRIQQRLSPQSVIRDDSGTPEELLRIQEKLFLTNPADDLGDIRRFRKRVENTCEWILSREEYISWIVNDNEHLLRVAGNPGIGKTMIASFLVDHILETTQRTPRTLFAYYFCDDKNEKRNTSNAILRGLLLQLLRQQRDLFKHIEPEVKQNPNFAESFGTLWRMFSHILEDTAIDKVYILVDALDECEKSSRRHFLAELESLLRRSSTDGNANFKILITSRFEDDIEESTTNLCTCMYLDREKVNADLSRFIQIKVQELASRKKYSGNLRDDVEKVLLTNAGGTFLWASLILADLEQCRPHLVKKKLETLPKSLNEVYDRILRQIEEQDVGNFIFNCVVAARRPLTVREIAVMYLIGIEGWDKSRAPRDEDLHDFVEVYQSCAPILYVDSTNSTINFVHQSAKDYLQSRHLTESTDISRFHIAIDMAHYSVFSICWKFINLGCFHEGQTFSSYWHSENVSPLFSYVYKEWRIHAVQSDQSLMDQFVFKENILGTIPHLRDTWLLRAAQEDSHVILASLLKSGANINTRGPFGETPVHLAASSSAIESLKTLIKFGADVNIQDQFGDTPFSDSVYNRRFEVARLLVHAGADINIFGKWLPSRERSYSSSEMIQLFIEAGANLETRGWSGEAPLHTVARRGDQRAVQLLIEAGVNVDLRDDHGGTCLHQAVIGGNREVAKMLLVAGVPVDAKNHYGGTSLINAVLSNRTDIIDLLIDAGADINTQTDSGATGLHYAVNQGNQKMIEILLGSGAEIDTKDVLGQTCLLAAAKDGMDLMVKLLIAKGADTSVQDELGRTYLNLAALKHKRDLEAHAGLIDHNSNWPLTEASI